MDHALKCNEMKCRAELTERALVTTCGHIFCVDCANRTGLNGASLDRHTCPACQAHLSRPDDAIVTVLNPSEDYKTSVLSGLNPEAIMECAGRALSFWSYQMTQDIFWESHRCKILTNRCQDLKASLDNVLNQANSQIASLNGKIGSMTLDQENLRRKNDELSQAYKERNRKLLQTQELYDKLKRKALLGHIQDAASDAVDTTLNAGLSSGTHSMGRFESQAAYEQQMGTPYVASRYDDRLDRQSAMPAPPRIAPPDNQNVAWPRPINPQVGVPLTPSTHRQRPGGDGVGLSAVPGLVSGTPVALHGAGRMRQPLRELQHNQRSNIENFTGVGLSSHLKASQGPATATTYAPTMRPRVAQRPGVPAYGATNGVIQHGVGAHLNSSV